MNNSPHVYLVGAGPGDPDLLTVKAQRLLREANVVVYDRLVSPEIFDLIPAGAARFYVGKSPGHHHMTQNEINHLLVSLARAGKKKIIRLKGGDPLIFGRGSEEAGHLVEHNIAFSVVPGVTSAAACSAYAGIPLTHRGLSTGVRIVTGHCQKNRPLNLNWASLADPDTTLVVYMGLGHIDEISRNLIQAGLPGDTPAAVIENGTRPEQRRCLDTLAGIPAHVRKLEFQTPSLIIIGRAVSLASDLDWLQTLSSDKASGDQLLHNAHVEA